MTKTLRVIGTLLTAVVLALNFTACGDDDDDDENGKGGTMTKEDFPGNYYVSSTSYDGKTDYYKEDGYVYKITNISKAKYRLDLGSGNYEDYNIPDSAFSKDKKTTIGGNLKSGVSYIKITGQYSFQIIDSYDDGHEHIRTFTKSGH